MATQREDNLFIYIIIIIILRVTCHKNDNAAFCSDVLEVVVMHKTRMTGKLSRWKKKNRLCLLKSKSKNLWMKIPLCNTIYCAKCTSLAGLSGLDEFQNQIIRFYVKKTKYNTDVVTSNIAACLAFSWRAPLLLSTSSSTWWSTHFFLCYCKHACATKFKTLISCSFFFPITTSQNLHHYQFSKFNKFSFFMSCIIMCHVSGCKALV